MTEQDWQEAGFTEASLGPGECGWIRNLPNGSYILVTELDYDEFGIGLYTPQWDGGPSVYLEISHPFKPGVVPDEISTKELLIPMLKSFESVVSVLSAKTPA